MTGLRASKFVMVRTKLTARKSTGGPRGITVSSNVTDARLSATSTHEEDMTVAAIRIEDRNSEQSSVTVEKQMNLLPVLAVITHSFEFTTDPLP